MTQEEKDKRTQTISERMLELLAVMAGSDAYASKCVKLGVSFKDVYPSEYSNYLDAREEYNKLESELKELSEAEVEMVTPADELGN